MKPLIFIFIFLTCFISCSTEKVMPFDGDSISLTSLTPVNRNFKEQSDVIFYSSEITNLISTFPKLKNKAVNDEVNNLKIYIKDYIYASQEYNVNARNKASFGIEKSYKKIQKLRKYLDKDEDDIVNRYLVRIKGNITKLEALQNNPDSISIKQ